jgi:hypothetical protein
MLSADYRSAYDLTADWKINIERDFSADPRVVYWTRIIYH